MPESDATDKEQQALPAEGLWHDKILGDAIGYTKGLVNILDSLNEGFRRRGKELEEQRHRLAILQSERRAILEERAALEAQIASITAGRDGLLAKLEERERELEKLRQAVSHDESGLETRAREVQELRVGMTESNRQLEELREIVRSLERQLQRGRQSAVQVPPIQIPSALSTVERPSATADSEGKVPSLRRADDAQIGPLVAERDELRFALDTRERDLHDLRQGMAQDKAEMEARAREVQELQARMSESLRQLEELRDVVRRLEREKEDLAQYHAARVAEIEGELQRVRESASQQQTALQEDLADAEDLLGAARKDLASAQAHILRLDRALDAERSRNSSLEERLQVQEGEIAQLKATVQAAQTLLNEIIGILGSAAPPANRGGSAGQAEGELSDLAGLAEGVDAASDQIQEVLTVVRPIVEAVQEVLGPMGGPSTELRAGPSTELRTGPAAGQPPVRERTQKIAMQWRRFLEERAELLQRARRLREENGRLSAQVAGMLGGRDSQQVHQQPVPVRDPAVRGAEGALKRGQEDKKSELPAVDKAAGPFDPSTELRAGPSIELRAGGSPSLRKGVSRRGSFVGMTVECMLEGSGSETTRILRGEITRINTMGLMGAFEERLPEGRRVIVRFARDGEDFSFLGRVVRVQQSPAAPGAPVSFDHLIRFEAPMAGPADQLATFLNSSTP